MCVFYYLSKRLPLEIFTAREHFPLATENHWLGPQGKSNTLLCTCFVVLPRSTIFLYLVCIVWTCNSYSLHPHANRMAALMLTKLGLFNPFSLSLLLGRWISVVCWNPSLLCWDNTHSCAKNPFGHFCALFPPIIRHGPHQHSQWLRLKLDEGPRLNHKLTLGIFNFPKSNFRKSSASLGT